MNISKIFINISAIFLWLALTSSLPAQQGSSNLVLMSLSAHPDDEDGATLAYYAKIKHVKTFSVFYTRGEGGQNEIGSQLGDDLGVLRTKETRDAATILGSEVLFLGFPDFGFSKTAKETFAMWGGHDSVLARIVYVIRALKPDVIITNHDTVTTKPKPSAWKPSSGRHYGIRSFPESRRFIISPGATKRCHQTVAGKETIFSALPSCRNSAGLAC